MNEARVAHSYTSKQLLRLSIPKGFVAVNEARLGAKPRWVIRHDPARAVICRTCDSTNTTACGGCYLCGRPLAHNHNKVGS
jgi:hypothetical protein